MSGREDNGWTVIKTIKVSPVYGPGGGADCSPPKFWAAQEIWAKLVLKKLACVCVFFFSKRYFLFQPEVGVVQPVKFTRDSGCLAHDQFLLLFEADHMLIYIFVILLLLGTVLHCTS